MTTDEQMIDAAWLAHKQAGEPDWPPRISAVGVPNGYLCNGSTGQMFEAQNGQWVRKFGVLNAAPRT